MSYFRANSSPNVVSMAHQHDLVMEGVATNVKLLLKLIDDFNHGTKDASGRNPQRLAGMLGIIDDVRSRVEKSQKASAAASSTRREAELRRCNTDLRRAPAPNSNPSSPTGSGSSGPSSPSKDVTSPRPALPQDLVAAENRRLRKELAACTAARKSLEGMFSSLGKEKAIMTAELARKAAELGEMEQMLEDLREQNQALQEKVRHYRDGGAIGGGSIGRAMELEQRNKELSGQLIKSLDGYRSLKRRLRDAHEGSVQVNERMAEVSTEVTEAVLKVQFLQRVISGRSGEAVNVEQELQSLGRLLHCVQTHVGEAGSEKTQ